MPLEVIAGILHIRREYLSSVANVLTNGPKVSTLTKGNRFPTLFIPYSWENKIIVARC